MTKSQFSSLLFLLFFIVSPSVFGRDYQVKGTVTDTLGTPAEFMTWRVFSESDTTKVLRGGVTEADGKFDAILPDAGKYRLSVVSMETAPLTVNFEVTKEYPLADLGKLTVRQASKDLKEMVITAMKPLVTREIDRIGYDVKSDPEATTATLDIILRKVPMVTVENDGTIKVNGSSDFKIYKNGRPNKSLSNNAKEVFKAIPASSIKKVEVITEPGVREDAEGAVAVLNIVTDTDTGLKGVTGTAVINANNLSAPSPYLYITTQLDKVTLSLSGGTYSYNSRQSRQSNRSERYYEESGNSAIYDNLSSSQGIGGWGDLELSYELDSLNLFTGEFSMYSNNNKNWLSGTYDFFSPTGQTLYSYKNRPLYPTRNTYLDFDGNFNYQHSTRREGETITLSYQISHNTNTEKDGREYYDGVNMPMPYHGITSDNKGYGNEHTVQLDWSRPLSAILKFDVGGKWIYRDMRSKSHREYLGFDEMDSKDDFTHTTNIGAIYTDWRLNVGSFGARAGVRYEYSKMKKNYNIDNGDNYGSTFNDWVPSIALSYQFNQSNTLKASYGRRISRPYISMLDPTEIITPTATSTGNPNLKSAYFNTVNLEYSMFKPKFSFNLNLGYTNSSSLFIEVTDIINDHSYSTYRNSGKSEQLTASAFVQATITPKTTLYLNARWSLNRMEDPTRHIHLTRPSYNTYLNLRQSLPWKLDLNASVYLFKWGGRSLYSYTTMPFSHSIGHYISLRRTFLKEDRLAVGLGVSNPFGPHSYKYTTYGVNTGMKSVSKTYQKSPLQFQLSVSYRFGSLNAYVKKVNRTISNDDMSKSSGGGQGGQGGGQGGGK